ncbi:RagB/SusD family nutrient uptake outer membrane protein, partial [Flavobacterium hauense]
MFVACNDAIDIIQPSELLPEDTYETVKDMQLGLNGAYGALPGENSIYFTSMFTDEVRLGRSNGGQGTDGELAFQLNNSSSDAASIWQSNYYAINLANRLILGAKGVVPADEDELAQYNSILAEAYFIRAFAHFQLISYFSPNMEDDNALGVILVDFVPTIEMKLPRSTNGEIYALIN